MERAQAAKTASSVKRRRLIVYVYLMLFTSAKCWQHQGLPGVLSSAGFSVLCWRSAECTVVVAVGSG